MACSFSVCLLSECMIKFNPPLDRFVSAFFPTMSGSSLLHLSILFFFCFFVLSHISPPCVYPCCLPLAYFTLCCVLRFFFWRGPVVFARGVWRLCLSGRSKRGLIFGWASSTWSTSMAQRLLSRPPRIELAKTLTPRGCTFSWPRYVCSCRISVIRQVRMLFLRIRWTCWYFLV